MPAGSRPDSRSPSRAWSEASMAKLRWTASTAENSTATQKSPGAAWPRKPRSGSRAKANRMSTSRAKGRTWLVATRERSSTRMSLPATSAASRHMDALRGVGRAPAPEDQLLPLHLAPRHGYQAAGQRPGPVGLVRSQQDRAAPRRRLPHHLVHQVPPRGVQAGMGLVEQPQLGATGQQDGTGDPATLAGGQ